MDKFIFLIFVLEYFVPFGLPAPVTEETEQLSEGSKGKLPIQNVENDKNPKLRILFITWRFPFNESHYMINRKLAEMLAADTENVEKVVLLVNSVKFDSQSTEEPRELDGRFSEWTIKLKMPGGENKSTVWEDNGEAFVANANYLITVHFDFLLNNSELIRQLQALKFNVGIFETSPWEYSMNLLRAFPTIKKYVIAMNTALSAAQWKYLGYEKIVGAMPGRNLARIGDHKFATEKAIRENMDYFRDRNENLYIKPLEHTSKLVEAKFVEAIKNGKLPKENFEDLFKHDHFTEWDVKHRMDLIFTDTQPFLDFPIVEQEIEREKLAKTKKPVHFIGGITMPKGTTVPKLNDDTKQIFDSANGGVVLLSFGSVIEMDDGEKHAVSFKNTVVNVFKQYTQMNMIIKWGKQTTPIGTMTEEYQKLAPNIYAKSWLEQLAILGSEPKLFITHGGQKSINEAVKFGVPLILFPFFGDQYNNAEALAARGAAKVLDFRSKTLGKDLTEAMDEIFANYSAYKQKMDELSKKLNSVDPAKVFLEEFRQLRKSL